MKAHYLHMHALNTQVCNYCKRLFTYLALENKHFSSKWTVHFLNKENLGDWINDHTTLNQVEIYAQDLYDELVWVFFVLCFYYFIIFEVKFLISRIHSHQYIKQINKQQQQKASQIHSSRLLTLAWVFTVSWTANFWLSSSLLISVLWCFSNYNHKMHKNEEAS